MNRYFRGQGTYERDDSDSDSSEHESKEGEENSEAEKVIKITKIERRAKAEPKKVRRVEPKPKVEAEAKAEVMDAVEDEVSEEESSGESSEESSEESSDESEPKRIIGKIKFTKRKTKKTVITQTDRSGEALRTIERNFNIAASEEAEKERKEGWGKQEDEIVAQLDDSDGQNVEEEYEAWRQRELARLRRDRKRLIEREEGTA